MTVQTSPSVLFVCLGNICRSPLAEAALKEAAARSKLAIHVDSAGTSDWHIGRPPDPRAQAVAREHGVDIGHYQARQLASDDFRKFTHILALDEQNLADIRQVAPVDATAHVALLMDMVPGHEGASVADPYFGDDAGFLVTWAEVTMAADALLPQLS